MERAEKITRGNRSEVRPHRTITDKPPASSAVALLQRYAGNRAAQRILHRCGPTPCDCSPERQLAAATYAGMPVSHPHDPAEREADQIAELVTRDGGPAVARHSGPLDMATRAWFEARLGASLAGVRVHTDQAAAEAADRLHARAFTVGTDISFATGEYAPHTPAGRRLLAHELVHAARSDGGQVVYRQPADTFHDRGTGPVRPGSKSFYFQGVELSTDLAYTKLQLKLLVSRTGIQGLELWHAVLHGERSDVAMPFSAYFRAYGGLRVRNPMDARQDMENDALRKEIGQQAVAVEAGVYPVVHAEAMAIRDLFQRWMGGTLEGLLQESSLQLHTQAVRYGLPADLSRGARAQQTVGFGAVVGAANDLLAVRRRIGALRAQQDALKVVTSPRFGTTTLPDANVPRYEQLGKQADALEATYGEARISAATRHPALGAILDDASDQTAALQAVSRSPAASLTDIMRSRQRSIDKVRSKIKDDPELLWTLPEIVAITQAVHDTHGNIMADAIIQEKLHQLKFDDDLKKSFLVVAGLGLGLLAAVGFGVGVVGSAVLSSGTAVSSVRNYLYQHALATTDLNKRASALAAEEPSLAWLAVDITFALLDVKAAAGVFHELSPLARAAQLGEDAEATAELVRRADKLGKPGLGRRLLDRLASMRGRSPATRLLGAAGEAEVSAVAHATEEIGREAGAATKVASAAGHEVKVTRSGLLVICSDCTWLRERFARELAADAGLMDRMVAAEGKAARGTLDAATKAEIGQLTHDLQQVREARLVADVGPVAARAVLAGDARAAFRSVLSRRPVIARELDDLERTLTNATRLDPATAAQLDQLRGRLAQLQEIDAVSRAPQGAQIIEVAPRRDAANFYRTVSETVPGPPVVLEFPDGSRVWRDTAGGPIRHEATLGDSLGRAGMERDMYSATAHGNLPAGPGYERAHSLGQGTGFESPYGIFYAPEFVNQTLQNRGIEAYLRDLAAKARPGESFRVVTRTVPHPGTLRLSGIDYSILRVSGGQAEEVATYSIRITSSAEHPVVTAAAIRFSSTPAGQSLAAGRVPLPPPITAPATFTY